MNADDERQNTVPLWLIFVGACASIAGITLLLIAAVLPIPSGDWCDVRNFAIRETHCKDGKNAIYECTETSFTSYPIAGSRGQASNVTRTFPRREAAERYAKWVSADVHVCKPGHTPLQIGFAVGGTIAALFPWFFVLLRTLQEMIDARNRPRMRRSTRHTAPRRDGGTPGCPE